MPFPPNAYLIGAEKSGTTTLTDLLAQHPSLTVSNPRDADFFSRNYSKGLDWYRTLFGAGPDKLCLDVSLSYTTAPLTRMAAGNLRGTDPTVGIPGRIHAQMPDARFIYILRDPVTRTYSSYWHAVRYGFKDIGFRKALDHAPQFLDTSDYLGQLRLYLDLFPIESFHFVVFEEMKTDPVGAAQGCFGFLGAGPVDFTPEFERPKNVSFRYNAAGRLLRSLSPSGEAMNRLIDLGQRLTPRVLEPWARRLISGELPSLSDADRRYLLNYFREKNRELERVTGLSLERWQA